jgi:hypothetical protein
VQERLTKQVAECLAARLRARGVGVVLEAEHSCMTLRASGPTAPRPLRLQRNDSGIRRCRRRHPTPPHG